MLRLLESAGIDPQGLHPVVQGCQGHGQGALRQAVSRTTTSAPRPACSWKTRVKLRITSGLTGSPPQPSTLTHERSHRRRRSGVASRVASAYAKFGAYEIVAR